MTPPATQPPDTARRLDALAEAEREAWARYLAELESLDGTAYAHTEPVAWDSLQTAVAEVVAERATIAVAAVDGEPAAGLDR